MKIKKLSRLLSLIIAMAVTVANFAPKLQAAEFEKGEILSQEISYVYGEEAIREIVKIIDSDGSEATVINQVEKTGDGMVMLVKNDEILSEVKYEAGINMYFYYESTINNGIMAYGADITGNQYRHRYVGSTSAIYENNSLDVFVGGTVANIAAQLIKDLSIEASIAISLASNIYSLGSALSNYSKLEVNSHLYEVLRSYDNTYYTHCYHCTFYMYDSGNHLIKSGVEYYQVIGS